MSKTIARTVAPVVQALATQPAPSLPQQAAAKHISQETIDKAKANNAAKVEAMRENIAKMEKAMPATKALQQAAKAVKTASETAAASVLKGKQAQGAALAVVIVNAAKDEGTKWRVIMESVFKLDNPGRATMRQDLNKLGKEMAATNKEIKRTAFTRISECINLSRACDLGMTTSDVQAWWEQQGTGKPFAGLTHAAIVASQRTYRESKAATGVDVKGPTRRKAMTPIQRAAKYLLSNFNAKELSAIRKAIGDVLAPIHKDADVATTLATMFPKAVKA